MTRHKKGMRCFEVWMSQTVCPGNRLSQNPGVRHICDRRPDHTGVCKCACGEENRGYHEERQEDR